MNDSPPTPDATCDGGDLDCGSGLLLIIRSAMVPLAPGGVLLVKSRERSVKEDLPAWCRMVGHGMLQELAADGGYTHYYLRKKGDDEQLTADLQRARDHVWQTRTRWAGGMQAKVSMRNHGLLVGQPASFDTQDEAPSAIELLLAAIGGAINAGLAWRLSQRGVTVRNLEVVVKGKLADSLVFLGVSEHGDGGLQALEVSVYLDADSDDAAPVDFDAILQETLRRCPVTQSVQRGVPVRTQIKTT